MQDVTDRRVAEDQHPPPGQLRRAHRPAQPPPADLARRARARAARAAWSTSSRCC
ncbi:MAG: hypothetical protein MZW92_00135 [Comamonadaceae bacterium]|nr:hypothetical protein [Comamonadaceae bacterium]